MLLMFERGIRGGITQAVHRYASVNNHYMGDKFNPLEESSYLQYLDANNLYGLRGRRLMALKNWFQTYTIKRIM